MSTDGERLSTKISGGFHERAGEEAQRLEGDDRDVQGPTEREGGGGCNAC